MFPEFDQLSLPMDTNWTPKSRPGCPQSDPRWGGVNPVEGPCGILVGSSVCSPQIRSRNSNAMGLHKWRTNTMARWLIQLEGDQMDLDEFPYWFPNGDVYTIEENGTFYLVGPAFEMLSEPDQVHEAALQAVHEFYGIASLLWSSLRRPEVGIVFREDERGKREGSAFLSGSANLRSKARGTLTTGGGAQHRRSPTTAQLLLSGSWRDKHIRTALDLWADPLRTWPRLYPGT